MRLSTLLCFALCACVAPAYGAERTRGRTRALVVVSVGIAQASLQNAATAPTACPCGVGCACPAGACEGGVCTPQAQQQPVVITQPVTYYGTPVYYQPVASQPYVTTSSRGVFRGMPVMRSGGVSAACAGGS